MSGYADKLRREVERWAADGLIPPGAVPALLSDIETRHGRGIGLGQVLAIMAALLFSAAILLMVAANWEEIPRLVRVGVLFGAILAGYVGGAVLMLRGNPAMAEAAWLIASATFGAAIALVGQMYHLTGDEAQAILLWCAGTTAAALALRSPVQTVAAVGLAIVWALYPASLFNLRVDLWFAPLLLGLWLVATWTGSIAARHLILLALIGHGVMLFVEHDTLLIPVAIAALSAAVAALALRYPREAAHWTGLGHGLVVDGFLGFLVGMFLLQFLFAEEVLMALLAVITLGGIAAALFWAGNKGRSIRWLAYAGFAGEIVFIYLATLGTMLGTAGFFVLAAGGLALLAFVVIRVERRLALRAANQGRAGA